MWDEGGIGGLDDGSCQLGQGQGGNAVFGCLDHGQILREMEYFEGKVPAAGSVLAFRSCQIRGDKNSKAEIIRGSCEGSLLEPSNPGHGKRNNFNAVV